MASSSFAPAASQGGSFGFASTTMTLPGAGTVLRVANLGPCHISVAFGAVVTGQTGLAILAGHVEYLTVPDGATQLAGFALGGPGQSSTVNLSSGVLA